MRVFARDESTEWMHWARVFAVLGVIAIHTMGHNATLDGARGTVLGKVAIGIHVLSGYAVPMFVMLSGALLLDRRRACSDGEFLRARAIRLVPALAFWHVFYFGFRRLYLNQTDISVGDYVVLAMNGKAFTALYYFWVIGGLALVTPVIRPWVQAASERSLLIAGGLLAALPAATLATHRVRGAAATWVETPWTWFFFYLGFYVLGYALRNWTLTRVGAIGGLVLLLGTWYVTADNWLNPLASPLVLDIFGRSYYHFGTLVLTTVLFVLQHSFMRADGPLGWLISGRALRLGRTLGAATLGVFALHMAVWWWTVDSPVLGDERAASSLPEMFGRFALISAVTTLVVLIVRRIPLIRSVV